MVEKRPNTRTNTTTSSGSKRASKTESLVSSTLTIFMAFWVWAGLETIWKGIATQACADEPDATASLVVEDMGGVFILHGIVPDSPALDTAVLDLVERIGAAPAS